MCWIMVKDEENEIPYDYINEAQKKNEDGYGVSWFENGVINTFKTLVYSEILAKIETLKFREFILHLRNTTAGLSDVANSHPFEVPSGVMFHNGTIANLKPLTVYQGGTLEDQDKSDTAKLAELISECEYENVSDIAPLLQAICGYVFNKLVFMNNDGTIDIVNEDFGIMDPNGNWYSNDYHIPPPPKAKTKVFVYGTLKEGYYNHDRHLGKATKLYDATTKLKMAMIGDGWAFPFLLGNHPKGYHIKGEVYEVTDAELAQLDILEGVPHMYNKRVIAVEDDKFLTHYVTCYVKSSFDSSDYSNTFLEEF